MSGARIPSSWPAGLWRSSRPPRSAPQLPGPQCGSRSGPPASDPPPALGPSLAFPSSCAPTPHPGSAVGLELVDVPAAVFLQGGEVRRETGGTTRQAGPQGYSALPDAAQCTLGLDPSWAAPRFCVPQALRLAAALAHKVVGNKIAFPGPNGWGFAKFREGIAELTVVGSPASPSKDLCLLTWPPGPAPPLRSSLREVRRLEVISAALGAGGRGNLEGPAGQGDCNRGFWGCHGEASAGEWILPALWPNPRPSCRGSEALRKSKHTENRPETWTTGKRTQQTGFH